MNGDAVISECQSYRYLLVREWLPGQPSINWIMLNPSTADARRDDATIRRCLQFSRAWGYGRMVVTNLFAFRATDPEALKMDADPVGPDNDEFLLATAAAAKTVVLGWGTHGEYRARGAEVCQLLKDFPLKCLGVTNGGFPRHPLFMKSDTQLEPYLGRAR
jgi:hypothetical protein